jgi:hypothetical protein
MHISDEHRGLASRAFSLAELLLAIICRNYYVTFIKELTLA